MNILVKRDKKSLAFHNQLKEILHINQSSVTFPMKRKKGRKRQDLLSPVVIKINGSKSSEIIEANPQHEAVPRSL